MLINFMSPSTAIHTASKSINAFTTWSSILWLVPNLVWFNTRAHTVINIINTAGIPDINHFIPPLVFRYTVIMIRARPARVWLTAPNKGHSFKAPFPPAPVAKASASAVATAIKVAIYLPVRKFIFKLVISVFCYRVF